MSDVAPGLYASVMLCDAAQVNSGKLYVLGGGLGAVGPKPQPLAVAISITVPWDRANIPHAWKLELLDEDGHPYLLRGKPLVAEGRFEAGRPAGLRPGSPLSLSLAINLAPFPLEPDRAYAFCFSIEGEARPEWRARFVSRPAAAPS